MLNNLKDFLRDLVSPEAGADEESRVIDTKLAAAALMVHVIVADGKVTPEEDSKLRSILIEHYGLDRDSAEELAEEAKEADSQAIDLYSFTSVLKQKLDETERMGLVDDLWEMVYADGKLHEFEDNVVWRVAELLGITSEKRIALKLRVRDRLALDERNDT